MEYFSIQYSVYASEEPSLSPQVLWYTESVQRQEQTLTSGLNYMTDPCASTTPVQAVLGFEPRVSGVLSYISSNQIKKLH